MGLTRVAIHRPVFILMVILAMVVLGLVSFTRLNAELFPNINVPVVTVATTYQGAAPDDVDRLVTQPILDAVSGLANIDYIQSSSAEGASRVTITFTDAANVDVAAIDVQRRIGAISNQLPADADDPSVLKLDPSQQPVLYLTFSGDQPLDRLYQFADDRIKPRLESQNGVASVTINGGLEREIQVQVDPNRLRAYGLTIDQVQQALSRENQGQPSGAIDRGRDRTTLRVYGLFQSVDELRDLLVIGSDGSGIRLGEVANIVDTYKRVTSRTFLNGREAVSLTVTKQSGSNEIATVDGVRAELARLDPELPAGTQLTVINDTSIMTRNSLDGVYQSLFEAVILTGLVLLIFLHTMRSTLIVLFAIPTSLISTFLAMMFLGFTLNLMSSIALVMVIGVLVDDSIVVLENIFRHLELGETPWTAALKGRSEIGMAAIAITLVDVVVFTPVAFMSGTVGSFFKQFGLVIASATLLSLFVSFTLTPMLASRWLKSGHQRPAFRPWRLFVNGFEAAFSAFQTVYSHLLGWVLRHRWIPVLVGVASLVAAIAMVPAGLIKFEFIPSQDSGQLSVTVEMPPGSSLDATEGVLRVVEGRLADIPEMKYYLSQSGVGGGGGGYVAGGGARFGRIQGVLVDRHDRTRSLNDVVDDVIARTRDIPVATIRVGTPSGGGGSAQPIQVLITGEDPRTLQTIAGQVQGVLEGIAGARDITNSESAANPEMRIVPDRRRMADAGVSAQQVAQVVRTAVDGTVATKLRPEGQDEVDVRLIATTASRGDMTAVGNLPITATRGGQTATVALSQVVRFEPVNGPTSLDRRNRQRLVTVGASLVGSTPLNDVSQPLNQGITQLKATGAIPAGYNVSLGGQSEQQAKAFTNMLAALGLSIVLEYMLLAALYESFILPFATMFALPLAIIGAFVGLAVTHNTLNLLSMIGVVVLMGLVGKNGILLVDYANNLRRAGMPRTQALRTAGETRLRPILMTTVALVVGLMPLALGLEEGSEVYKGMASVIIGGMLSSTLLSLLVVPCMYTYFDDFQALIGRAWRWRPFRRRRADEANEPVVAEQPMPNGHAAPAGQPTLAGQTVEHGKATENGQPTPERRRLGRPRFEEVGTR
ncbi:MAG: efflux RND transporter permease subunit [Chloroflexi bacterium]|nr:efflux RND transporter permease subunit [Chloroflexota bacterium]